MVSASLQSVKTRTAMPPPRERTDEDPMQRVCFEMCTKLVAP